MSQIAVPLIERIQARLHTIFPQVVADGDIGKITIGGLRDLQDRPTRIWVQEQLEELFPQVRADGVFGPITWSAIRLLDEMGDHESLAEMVADGSLPEEAPTGWNDVTCSSFADPADIATFRKCKAAGGSDVHCFAKGDNGIGAWGADCTAAVPYVALPREVWRHAGKRGGAAVEVGAPGVSLFRAILGDTMPSKANIKNGAGMDANPYAVKMMGERPPIMLPGVRWRWA